MTEEQYSRILHMVIGYGRICDRNARRRILKDVTLEEFALNDIIDELQKCIVPKLSGAS